MDFEFSEEENLFQTMVHDFVAQEITPAAAQWEEQESFPQDVWKKLAELGICGVALPSEYGGGGGGKVLFCIATEEISRGSAGLATAYLVSCGVAMESITKHGTEEQKKTYISRCANGEIAYFAVTEAAGGSDVARMQTKYTQEGEYYLLNGSKLFITSGEESSFGVVYATRDTSLGYRGISCFVVEKDNPGLSVGKKEKKTGQHCGSTTELIFDNCKIPVANRVGEEGKGFKMALEAIDASRISIGAQALGIAEAACDAAVAYAKERNAFGKSLAQMQAIQWMIADMATEIEVARLLVYKAAWLMDQGRSFIKEATTAKLFATEASRRVCQKAVQIFGGYGYSRDFAVERYARDQRVTEIYEGTSEMQRWAIARQILGVK
ncbi:MAG: acyl-CoA dehydrogenase family protein [Chloroflexota bacterium]|nr:acyl-CoA dehydrogenase family protein [Chloroflexota bacterium]